jgi:DNA-binding NarL/FixJ family response regulator
MYQKAKPERIEPPHKVLVISSDTLLAETVRKILDRYFACDIYDAACTAEATSQLIAGGFDLFLVDLSTPEISGDMLIKNIQTLNPSIPILVVACNDNNEGINEMSELGITQLIYKPIRIAAFLEIITGILMDRQRSYF